MYYDEGAYADMVTKRRLLLAIPIFLVVIVAFAGLSVGNGVSRSASAQTFSSAPVAPPTTPPGSGGSSGPGSTKTTGSCGMYGGPTGMGIVCAGTSGGETIEQVLAGQPVPGCWDSDPFASPAYAALSDGQITDLGLTVSPDFHYYLERCLTGINPTTFAVDPGGIKISQQTIYLPITAPTCPSPPPAALLGTCVMTLTVQQHDFIADRASNIPYPGAVPSPLPIRVNEPITFTSQGPTEVGPLNPGLGVEMRARMLSFEVYPLGADGVGLPCALSTEPDGTSAYTCSYNYARSSASQPNQQYRVRVEATWIVEYDAGGAWQALGPSFNLWSDSSYPVKEVQAVVVAS